MSWFQVGIGGGIYQNLQQLFQEILLCTSMITYERFETARNNFGKFLYQFQPETERLIRKLERILIKLYRHNVSLLFNQTHTHTHTKPPHPILGHGAKYTNYGISLPQPCPPPSNLSATTREKTDQKFPPGK